MSLLCSKPSSTLTLTQSWSQSLHEGRLGPTSSQPCRLSFRSARSFHPPAAILEEAMRACCSLWGLCMCSLLCWHGIPPNVQKARGLAGFRSAQTSFRGGLSWSSHIKSHTCIPSVSTLPPSALLSSKAVISTWHTSYLFTVFPRQNVSSMMARIHWIYSQFYPQGMG